MKYVNGISSQAGDGESHSMKLNIAQFHQAKRNRRDVTTESDCVSHHRAAFHLAEHCSMSRRRGYRNAAFPV